MNRCLGCSLDLEAFMPILDIRSKKYRFLRSTVHIYWPPFKIVNFALNRFFFADPSVSFRAAFIDHRGRWHFDCCGQIKVVDEQGDQLSEVMGMNGGE